MRPARGAILGGLALGWVLAGAVVGAPAAPANKTAEVDRDLDTARQLYREGRFGDAVVQLGALVPRLKDLRDAKSRKPRLLDAYLHLALCELALGEQPSAKQALKEMVRIDPSHRLDPDVYAPKLIELFEAARAEVGNTGRTSR